MRETEKRPARDAGIWTGRIIVIIGCVQFIVVLMAVGEIPLAFAYHETTKGVLYAAGLTAAFLLLRHWKNSLITAYLLEQEKAVDLTGIIRSYIDLESFDRSGTFKRSELSHLMPGGGFPHASYTVEGRNMIRGSWEGHPLRSAYVDYNDEAGEVAVRLFAGQYTEIEGYTGFPGKLLLIRPKRRLAGSGDGMRAQAYKNMLEQTGLKDRQVESVGPSGWEVYSDRRMDATALLSSNRGFVDRMVRASGMLFMLVEEDRVCFCGDYAFGTFDLANGHEGVKQDCEHAMYMLVNEGLDAVKTLWQDQ